MVKPTKITNGHRPIAPLLRLLPLLPSCSHLPSGSSSRRATTGRRTRAGISQLHPIVLLPGASCSNYEVRLTEPYRPSVPRCGAMKEKGWFRLWDNASDLLAHDYIDCFMEQISLVYDPVTEDYRNLPGVEMWLLNFGSATGFHVEKSFLQLIPSSIKFILTIMTLLTLKFSQSFRRLLCLSALRHALERIGYRNGVTLFGAPYDFRHAPPVPGQTTSEVFSAYFEQLARLVEEASKNNEHKKREPCFGHSFGGMVALEFVRSTPLAWRNRYIKHLILVAPTLSEGFMESVKYLISGTDMFHIPTTTPLGMRPMWRSFESAIVNLPSPAVFGHGPLVITKLRNYSAHDMEDLLAAIGFVEGIEPFRKRGLPRRQHFQAPMVPVTCINGVGNRTPRQLVYWESDFDAAPELVNGDGDGTINLVSMLAFDAKMRRQPGQKKKFKSIKLHGALHSKIVADEWALTRVMQEIHEANLVSS
ncbi:hypothetical protein ACP70R_026994 [Stipagrostis hirtigluma subsp. patula]